MSNFPRGAHDVPYIIEMEVISQTQLLHLTLFPGTPVNDRRQIVVLQTGRVGRWLLLLPAVARLRTILNCDSSLGAWWQMFSESKVRVLRRSLLSVKDSPSPLLHADGQQGKHLCDCVCSLEVYIEHTSSHACTLKCRCVLYVSSREISFSFCASAHLYLRLPLWWYNPSSTPPTYS